MSNPGRILNKWLTIKKKFEEHKKFKEVKDGPRHKLGIRNSLKELTGFTPAQVTTKAGQEQFEAAKTQTCGKLKKFCRVIKASKEGDAAKGQAEASESQGAKATTDAKSQGEGVLDGSKA